MDNETINNLQELSWQGLRKSGRFVSVPFRLNLTESSQPFIGEKVVRIIPDKRLVVFGTWGDKEVVAKLFYESGKAKQHVIRDKKGIDVLVQSGVLTPILYYQGTSKDKRIQVLMFEKIHRVCDYHDIHKDAASLKVLTLELATQHVLGILQKDMHFKNFLITPEKIYTLDGSDVEKFDQPLDKSASLKNLALLIAQLGAKADKYQNEMLHIYAEARSWNIKKTDNEFIQKNILKWQKIRWDKFQKKIFRNCSAFSKLQSIFTRIIYDRDYETDALQQFFAHPDAVFLQKNAQWLKKGNSASVIKANLDGHELVIKRYNIKNFWHGLRRCLRVTRAAKSWRLAQYLTLMGIATAKPIALVEKRFVGFSGKSYFVMESVTGMHMGEYFSQPQLSDRDKKIMAEKVMTLFKKLAELRLTHGDLKMTNILIRDDEPILIDLDGMKEHKCSFGSQRAFQKELERFLRNWDNQPSILKLFEPVTRPTL